MSALPVNEDMKLAEKLKSAALYHQQGISTDREWHASATPENVLALLAQTNTAKQEVARLAGHLMVMLDVVEDEEYDTHRERRLAALADLGLSGMASATPTKADIAAHLEHLASQMREIGEQMTYFGGLAHWARHGNEMQGAALIAEDWAESIRLELAGAPA